MLSGPEQLVDIREDRQDFAFQGDGFWLHGGLPKMEGNVVSGATGHAYIYWTEGLVEAGVGIAEIDPVHVPANELITSPAKIDVWWAPVSSFKNNIGYASVKGLVIYYLHATFLGTTGDDGRFTEQYMNQLHSTFEDTTLWRIQQRPVDFNFSEKITLKNFRIIGDGVPGSVGIDANHFHLMSQYNFENLQVEDFDIGMDVPTQGDIKIKGGHFANNTDFRIRNPQTDLRRLLIDGVTTGAANHFAQGQKAKIQMNPYFIYRAEIQDGLEDQGEDILNNPLFFLLPDRITLNFEEFDNVGLYFEQQAADFIPMTTANSQTSELAVPTEYVEKTNQQLKDSYDLMFGGALLPTDSQTSSSIQGGKIGPVAAEPTTMPPELDDGGDDDEG